MRGRYGHSPNVTNGRRRDESGVALVEAAIVLPLVMVLAFAVMEFGLLYSSAMDLKSATRAGARVGTATGVAPTTDHVILQTIRNSRGAIPEDGFNRIVIFNASNPSLGPSKEPHSSCKNGLSSAIWQCNVYSSANFADDAGTIDLLSSGYHPDVRAVGSDSLGIWIDARHPMITGIFGAKAPIKDRVIMRLEPAGSPSSDADDGPTPPPAGPTTTSAATSPTTAFSPSPPPAYVVPPPGDGNT